MKNSTIILLFVFILFTACKQNNDEILIREKIQSHLDNAQKQFGFNNEAFVIDFIKSDTVLFQIIHNSMIEDTRQKMDKFGFSIYLTFDLTFKTDSIYFEKFKTMEICKEFMRIDYDDVEVYVLGIKTDISKGTDLITKLILNLHNLKLEEFEIKMESQGPIRLE